MSTRGEFQRLADLAPHLARSGPGLPVGVGDDAAVVGEGPAAVVACLDVLVEGVHFRRDLSTPADVGWKSVAVNISDLAAMGARPEALLVGLQRPETLEEAAIDQLYRGMAEAASRWGARIVGGDTVTAPVWSISVTALGRPVGPVVTRGGARPGDRLGLVGAIGGAAAALWADEHGLDAPPHLWAAHRRPQAFPASGMAVALAGATAMIDISDGLGADAGHLARASEATLRLDADAVLACAADGVAELVTPDALRRLVLGGGEDFALLVAVTPALAEDCAARVADAGEGTLRWIGVVEAPGGTDDVGANDVGAVLLDGARIDGWGYDHG